MHADVVRFKMNAMHLPDMLYAMILFFFPYVQNVKQCCIFLYFCNFSVKISLNSDIRYNYETYELFSLPMIFVPVHWIVMFGWSLLTDEVAMFSLYLMIPPSVVVSYSM